MASTSSVVMSPCQIAIRLSGCIAGSLADPPGRASRSAGSGRHGVGPGAGRRGGGGAWLALVLPSLSIVIPAFNEAASIAATLRDALEVGAAHAAVLEVIVCDDGSRDETGAIAAAAAAGDGRVVVLRRAGNRGIEASIRALYA